MVRNTNHASHVGISHPYRLEEQFSNLLCVYIHICTRSPVKHNAFFNIFVSVTIYKILDFASLYVCTCTCSQHLNLIIQKLVTANVEWFFLVCSSVLWTGRFPGEFIITQVPPLWNCCRHITGLLFKSLLECK